MYTVFAVIKSNDALFTYSEKRKTLKKAERMAHNWFYYGIKEKGPGKVFWRCHEVSSVHIFGGKYLRELQ